MVFVSLTRLRLRSIRFLPGFALYAVRSQMQVQKAVGFLKVELLPDKNWAFWTLTAWESEEDLRRYMTSGAHKKAMPHLLHWCDEASVAHWTQEEAALPMWAEADRRMRETFRASKVKHPSSQHASLNYDPPKVR